ncbi:MAG: general secretion pathway protein GspK [Gammaproteobacteria bacterium]
MSSNETFYGRQRGVALVIVIWVLTLLTLMAASFAMTIRRDSSVSWAIKSNAEALAQAESGIILAEYMLSQNDPELRWKANGTVYQVPAADGKLRVRILAETGKVDINTSDENQLAALINWVTDDSWFQQQLLNAILDWRDADDDTRTMGAEKRQYRLAGLSYGPSNNAFQNLEELQLVLGMNEQVFTAIRPFITVYSGQAQVDYQNASPQLIAILAQDQKERNIDDQALNRRMEQIDGSDGDSLDAGSGAEQSIDNQAFTIVAESMVHGEASAGLEVVVKGQSNETGSPFQVLDWKQNLEGASLFDEAAGYPIITFFDEFKYDDQY